MTTINTGRMRSLAMAVLITFPLLTMVPFLVCDTTGQAFADEPLIGMAKASNLIGKNVKNTEGKDLGEVKEIVVDPMGGDIQYAVLSFGGFLGLGDKYFAIPWQAMKLSQDRKHFILNVDQKKMENAPGFDKDKWPDMSNRDWALVVYQFYDVQPKFAAKEMSGKGQQITVKGEVLEIQDEFYMVKDNSGREVRMHVDQDTKMSGKVQKGDKIEAKITQANHAQSIEKAD
jgi:sporulation protein YlmC with PRC-barrel domain